jgi:PIN domain nuclease of toxin-antitoxin system
VIVLDTHVLLWWVNGGAELSKAAKRAIDQERKTKNGSLFISAISVWEIAMLVQHERLVLGTDIEAWLHTVARIKEVRFVPVDNTIAMKSVALPEPFHKDPADRIIAATSRELSSPLVTADERIRRYAHVKTIW